MTDLYELLGLSRNATEADIKSAHRRLILQLHPDKNTNNKEQAAKKTADINNAKDILLDAQKRAIYDQRGFEGLNEAEKFGFHQQSNRQLPIKVCSTQVDLDAFYLGKVIKFTVPLRQPCKFCSGFGCSDRSKKISCINCKGHGKVNYQRRMGPMVQNIVGDCQNCNGKGFSIDSKFVCKFCAGQGIVEQQTEVEHYVKKGQRYGHFLLENKGDYIDVNTIGHLKLTLMPFLHSKFPFTRRGSNLHYDLRITLYEALMGFEIAINHIEPGKKIVITSRDVVQPGEVRRLSGWGMPKKDIIQEYGDLFITFIVELPRQITTDMRQSIQSSIPVGVFREKTEEEDRFPIELMTLVEKDDEEKEEEKVSDDESDRNSNQNQMPQFVHPLNGGGVQCAQQ